MRRNLPILEAVLASRPDPGILSWLDNRKEPRSMIALVASGSSLAQTAQDLAHFPGLVIAGLTNAGFLLKAGVKISAVLAMDTSPVLGRIAQGFKEAFQAQSVDLLAAPFVDKAVLEAFSPERVFFTQAYLDVSDYRSCPKCGLEYAETYPQPESYSLNNFFRLLWPEITAYVLQAGSVGSTAVQLINRLQVGGDSYLGRPLDPLLPSSWQERVGLVPPDCSVYLYGYDMAFLPDSAGQIRFRCPRWLDPQTEDLGLTVSSTLVEHISLDGKKITLTEKNQLIYKRALLAWLVLSWTTPGLEGLRLFRIGKQGILEELPSLSSWKEPRSQPWSKAYALSLYKTYLRDQQQTGIPQDYRLVPLEKLQGFYGIQDEALLAHQAEMLRLEAAQDLSRNSFQAQKPQESSKNL